MNDDRVLSEDAMKVRETLTLLDGKDLRENGCACKPGSRCYLHHHDVPQAFKALDRLASRCVELEAALQQITEVENTELLCVRHGGTRGADDPETCWCGVAVDAAEKAKAIARATLAPTVETLPEGVEGTSGKNVSQFDRWGQVGAASIATSSESAPATEEGES